jgi:hypothetical protein
MSGASGLFAEWQPQYAAVNVPSFPVKEKRPCVRGYLKVGMPASRELALKFGDADALGISLNRSKITVLDVDTPDERVLADAMAVYGSSPFIVRSGSGNWQAWYRNNGEGRRIRPDPRKPIDILGAGYVVAPPSTVAKGKYSLVQGSLDDLPNLPVMRSPDRCANLSTYTIHSSPSLPFPTREQGGALDGVTPGERNHRLWRFLMAQARHCDDLDALIDVAKTASEAFDSSTFTPAEVERTARSAWKYESEGRNWVGLGARPLPASEPIALIGISPDAFILWTLLQHNHAGKMTVIVANAMAKTMPPSGWRRERFAAARKVLVDEGHIHQVKSASTWTGAAAYAWGRATADITELEGVAA